jgi:hypothetical protein
MVSIPVAPVRALLLTVCFVFVFLPGFSSQPASEIGWNLPFGVTGAGLRYDNESVRPGIEEAAAFGPLAFRLHRNELWIADSVGGRVARVAPGQQIPTFLDVPGVASNTLLEDLALVTDLSGAVVGVWVADGADLTVRHISIADGREMMRVGGRGDQPGSFVQIQRLEVGPTRRLYVGDVGRGVISIFSPAGTLEREVPWERSGFVVDSTDHLHLLRFHPAAGYVHCVFGPDGRPVRTCHLGHPEAQNPRLWALDGKGAPVVSFVPRTGFRGVLHLVRFNSFGGISSWSLLKPPRAMNRFLDRDASGALWVAAADYEQAPTGVFSVSRVSQEAGR